MDKIIETRDRRVEIMTVAFQKVLLVIEVDLIMIEVDLIMIEVDLIVIEEVRLLLISCRIHFSDHIQVAVVSMIVI